MMSSQTDQISGANMFRAVA